MSNVQMIRDVVDQTIGETDTDNPSDRVPALERVSDAFGVLLHAVDGAAVEDANVAIVQPQQLTEEMLHALGGTRA